MKLTLFKSKKTKLIFSVFALAFNMLTSVTATFCWFIANKEAEINTEEIAIVNNPDLQVSWRYFIWDETNNQGKYKSSSFSTSTMSITFNSFDKYISSNNKRLSTYVQFRVSKIVAPVKNFNIIFKSTQKFLKRVDSVATNYVNPYISNAIKIRACVYSYTSGGKTTSLFTMGTKSIYKNEINPGSNVDYANTGDKYYQEVRKYFMDHDASYKAKTYVDVSKVEEASALTDESQFKTKLTEIDTAKNKAKNMTVTPFAVDSSGSTVKIPEGSTGMDIFVEFDYDATLAQFFSANKDPSTASSEKTKLSNDITTIQFKLA